MRYLKELIAVLALFLLIGNVSAEDSYDVTLTILTPENESDLGGNWREFKTITIDKNERADCIHKIMITDVALSTNSIYIQVIDNAGDRISTVIGKNEAVIFELEDIIKIKVNSIELETLNGDGIVANDDDIVSVWIEPNSMDKLSLNPSIPETFNPSEYGRTSGWSGTGSLECIELYIERLQSIGGVGVTITGGNWDEIYINTNNRRKFELNENGVYVVTVVYESVDVWGGVKDETETYTLSVTGLTYGTNTGSVSTITYEDRIFETFSGTINKYIIVETAVDGSWEEIDGAVTKFDAKTIAGKYSWKIKFDTAENHKVGFKGVDSSSGYYRFIVKESAPQSTATTIIADQTTTDGKSSSTGTVLAIFGVLILVGSLAIFFNKKSRNNGKDNTGGSRISPDVPT